LGRFDIDIPFTTDKEHQYVIQFRENNPEYLPENFEMTVVGVVIETKELPEQTNDIKTLYQIANILHSYLKTHDVILYAICSSTEINKSARRAHLSNQQYRSKLFDTIFQKVDTTGLEMKNLEIAEDDGDIEYFHLISFDKNHESMEALHRYYCDK
jgi:hypothetical protein